MHFSPSLRPSLVLSIPLMVAACSGSSAQPSVGPEQGAIDAGSPHSDAGVIGIDAATSTKGGTATLPASDGGGPPPVHAGDSGAGATADASSSPSFVSNTNATFRDRTPSSLGWVLRSSNFKFTDIGNSHYQEWFGELANTSSVLHCFPSGSLKVLNAHDAVIASLSVIAYGTPYAMPLSPLPAVCVAPGDTAILYASGFADTAIALADIVTVETHFTGTPDQAGPDPAAPVAGPPELQVTTTGTAVTGKIFAGLETINNVMVNIFAMNESGLIIDKTAALTSSLTPGSSATYNAKFDRSTGPIARVRETITYMVQQR